MPLTTVEGACRGTCQGAYSTSRSRSPTCWRARTSASSADSPRGSARGQRLAGVQPIGHQRAAAGAVTLAGLERAQHDVRVAAVHQPQRVPPALERHVRQRPIGPHEQRQLVAEQHADAGRARLGRVHQGVAREGLEHEPVHAIDRRGLAVEHHARGAPLAGGEDHLARVHENALGQGIDDRRGGRPARGGVLDRVQLEAHVQRVGTGVRQRDQRARARAGQLDHRRLDGQTRLGAERCESGTQCQEGCDDPMHAWSFPRRGRDGDPPHGLYPFPRVATPLREASARGIESVRRVAPAARRTAPEPRPAGRRM